MKFIQYLKTYQKALFLFLIAELFLYFILYINMQIHVKNYLDDTTNTLEAEYHMVLNAFENKAQIVFETVVNTPEVKAILKKVQNTTPENKNNYRVALYTLLENKFRKLQKFGFKQIHFHLPDNHSFLRLNTPQKYGDDLTSFRHTVVYTNKTHQKISAFEEGISNNGYRFVFPMYSNDNQYLGSVELTFSAYTLSEFLTGEFLDTYFIIAKNALIGNHENYVTSTIDDAFVIDKYFQSKKVLLPSDPRFKKHYTQENTKSFSLYTKIASKNYIETFIPIRNPITEETDAYLIILTDGKHIAQIQNTLWIHFSGLSVIILLLFLRHIRGKNFHKKIREQNNALEIANKQLKTIINSQDNMIIITDGSKIIDVNAKVLTFFGYNHPEQFMKRHQCICNFFLEHKDYFHMGKLPKGQDWIEYLESLPPQQKIITMVGTDMEAKAFHININKYGSNGSSIITLNDITDMIIQQKILQYKAQHDKLTDIYNRQKIDEVLEKICGYSTRRKEEIGIIMFDIDHFKKVNDQFGHATGDEVLKKVAYMIRNNIREEDIFGRWGGEEFLIILRHTSIENTHKKAEMLRKAIENMTYPQIPSITASFGVTKISKRDTPQAVLKRTDLALYKAKTQGRNCVVLSSDTVLQYTLV
jgi:diguanylate cyclase (GGDEF)-like protein